MKCTAIIGAGGIGKRFGSDQPKQFVELNGMPLIIRAVQVFQISPEIDSIVIAVNNEWLNFTEKLLKDYGISKVTEIVDGGKRRQDSIYNALKTKTSQDSDIILVHDAARPLVSINLVKEIVAKAEEYGAAIPGIAITDTVKERSSSKVVRTIERDCLCRIQTPQGFWQELIISSYKNADQMGLEGTDCSSLVELYGHKVHIVEGEESNIKITSQRDLKLAEIFLSEMK